MAEAQTVLINPCGVAMPPRYTLAPRAALSPGAVLGVLNNGKTNVQVILEHIARALQGRFGFADVLYIRKPGVALPCPEEQLQALVSRCAVVVNGVGDWGSCTSWSIHDGIALERRGLPTATLCTDEFAALAKRECGSLGMPDMPLVVLPHPTSALVGGEAQSKAQEVVTEIAEILTQDVALLATTYADRVYAAPKRAFRARQF